MYHEYPPLVWLSVILYPVCFCLNGITNNDCAIPKTIMQHVENSDLQILHDGDLTSDYVSFLQDLYLARTIIFMPQFEKRVDSFRSIIGLSFIIDVSVTRPAGNKISIWLSKRLLAKNLQSLDIPKFTAWLMVSTTFHYTSKLTGSWKYISAIKNTYPIIITKFSLEEAASVLEIYSHNIYYESLFILLISGRGLKICVKRLALLPNITESYDCKLADDGKILADYERLTPLQETWVGSYNTFIRDKRDTIEIRNFPHSSLNLFDGKIYKSIPMYMAAILVETGRNATFILQRNWDDDFHVEVETMLYIYNMEGMRWEFTYSTGLQFLSCYTDSYITFDFYVTPFQPAVWLSLLSSLLLTFMILSFYMFWKHKRSPIGLILTFLSLFFDDFTSVPNYMGNKFFYRTLFSAVGLVAVLLTNCYTGIMITELNAPLQQSLPETFQDLICQDRHILNSRDYKDIARWAKDTNLDLYWGKSNIWLPNASNTFASDSCFTMLSTPAQTVFGVTYAWYTHLVMKYIMDIKKLLTEFQLNKESPAISNDGLLYVLLLNPVHNFFPSGFNFTNRKHTMKELRDLVERDVTICEKKTVMIGRTELIGGEMDFLTKSYPSKKFYSGSDLLGKERSGWGFLGGGRSAVYRSMSPVHQRFKALVHSGIYSRLKREMARNMWKQRRPVANNTDNIISSMGMDGRLVTLFMICGALFSVALIVLLAEHSDWLSEFSVQYKFMALGSGSGSRFWFWFWFWFGFSVLVLVLVRVLRSGSGSDSEDCSKPEKLKAKTGNFAVRISPTSSTNFGSHQLVVTPELRRQFGIPNYSDLKNGVRIDLGVMPSSEAAPAGMTSVAQRETRSVIATNDYTNESNQNVTIRETLSHVIYD
ncbi:hypothetical protein Fcan01_28141 [Folsomia candida]|uniref:Uncharacterized protein n=1 Tax=Folsomia candida TaxID=158441 RepID=A0A226CWU1_FOLCA|nr:hypothetical protein Fcan01_28141 [Folsomia candida]